MKRKVLEQHLKNILHQPPFTADEQHLAKTCLLAEAEMRRIQVRERITFMPFLLMQIRYIGWKIWLVQGIFLLFISRMANCFYGISYPKSPLYMARSLFCLSVLVFMSALPFIYRSVRCRMQEIEAATRFSSVKLLMAKLIIIGIGDLFLLGGIFCVTIWKTSLRADSVILYLCFPFLLAGSLCLFLLGHLPSGQFFTGSMGACSFLILAAAAVTRHTVLPFYNSFSAGWIAVCAFLAAFCAFQFRYILYRSPYAEMQLS